MISGLCFSALLSLGLAGRASAAERVTLTFGFAEVSTSVEALRAYGERGEVSRELRFYLNLLSEEQRLQFRQALQVRQDVGPAQMSKFLRSSIGDNILDYLGNVVKTASRRNGKIGLRGALVLSAAEPEGLSLLGVLENFPTGTVRIDSLRGFQIVGGITAQIEDTGNAIAAIENQFFRLPSDLDSSTAPLASLAEPDETEYGEFTVQTFAFYDEARDRTIPTDLYIPVRSTVAAPVIVISHGLSGDRDGLVTLAAHLANQGFAVAALDHPASNRQQLESLLRGTAREISEPTEFVDRPRDVSFVLDEIDRLNQFGGPFKQTLNLDKVGVIGHSFGGYTALALAGAKLNYNNLLNNCESTAFVFNAANPSMLLQCTALNAPEQFDQVLKDDRVRAIMAINPIGSSLFGQAGFSKIDIPVLMVAGSSDPVAPALLEQIRPFTWLNHTTNEPVAEASGSSNPETSPQHYLALIEGGSHLYDLPTLESADVSLASGLISAEPDLAYDYLKALSTAFFDVEVADNSGFSRWLTQEAIAQLSQPALPLYVIDSLTPSALRSTARRVEELPAEVMIEDTVETAPNVN